MSDKFVYTYDESRCVMFKTYIGLITIMDIEASWEYAFANNIIPGGTKRFVLDYRKAKFDIRSDEYHQIPDFYQKHINIFSNCKIAVLTENPRDIVIPFLVQSKDEGYYSSPFSTLEAALNWVML